ncbi:MAG: hypothetical protein AAF664_07240 [Planctomycetota bacterium]
MNDDNQDSSDGATFTASRCPKSAFISIDWPFEKSEPTRQDKGADIACESAVWSVASEPIFPASLRVYPEELAELSRARLCVLS